MQNSLLEFHQLGHNELYGSRTVDSMGVVEVNVVNAEPREALLDSFGHVGGITTEGEAVGQHYGAEFAGEEDVLALLWVEGKPFADDDFYVSLVQESS